MGPTAVAGLIGAGLATVSSAQVWGRAEITTPAVREIEVRGSDVAPVALPLALVALAAWGAVLVLRRRGRRAVSVVGLLASAGVALAVTLNAGSVAETARGMVAGGAGRTDIATQTTGWPWFAVLGAVLTAVAFVAAYLAAPAWPEMSSRYDAPTDGPADRAEGTESSETSPNELWKALDEGRDPTA